MAVHLKDDFKEGTPTRLIRASWLNKVAKLWNWARGGRCINWEIPDEPCEDAGPRIDIDMSQLDAELAMRGFLKTATTTRLAPNAVNPNATTTEDDTAAHVAARAPEDDAVPATDSNGDETDASKIARIGTSVFAARSDHQHPVCLDIGSASAPDDSAIDSLPSGQTLDTSTWEAGGTDGLREMVCTRVYYNTAYRFFIFREKRYSKNGNLIYRGPEQVVVRARNS